MLARKPNGRKSLIDYILLRNARGIRNIERQVFVMREKVMGNYLDLSDHYGIEASIQFDIPGSLALSQQ
jgi:hypothetical protein